MPHSIACRVTEWEWPRIRCEILVERESQKGIVIGKGGTVLKAVGTAVREQHVSVRIEQDDADTWPLMQRAAQGPMGKRQTLKYQALLGETAHG